MTRLTGPVVCSPRENGEVVVNWVSPMLPYCRARKHYNMPMSEYESIVVISSLDLLA